MGFVEYVKGLEVSGKCTDGDFNKETCIAAQAGDDGWKDMCTAFEGTTCYGDYDTASRADFEQCCNACDSSDLTTAQQCCAGCPKKINDEKTTVAYFVNYLDVNLIATPCLAENIKKEDCEAVHDGNKDWKNMCGTLDQTSCTGDDEHVTPQQLSDCCTDCEGKDTAEQTTCCVACPESILTPDTTSEPEYPTSETENPAPEPENPTSPDDHGKTTANPSSSVDETTEANGTDVTDTSAPLAPMTATLFKVIAITALIAQLF